MEALDSSSEALDSRAEALDSRAKALDTRSEAFSSSSEAILPAPTPRQGRADSPAGDSDSQKPRARIAGIVSFLERAEAPPGTSLKDLHVLE